MSARDLQKHRILETAAFHREPNIFSRETERVSLSD